MRALPRVLFVGRISGMVGHTKAIATVTIAWMNAASLARDWGIHPASQIGHRATDYLPGRRRREESSTGQHKVCVDTHTWAWIERGVEIWSLPPSILGWARAGEIRR